jgi:hypothetical protein
MEAVGDRSRTLFCGLPVNSPALFRSGPRDIFGIAKGRAAAGNGVPVGIGAPAHRRRLPPARVCHPYPSHWLDVITRAGAGGAKGLAGCRRLWGTRTFIRA